MASKKKDVLNRLDSLLQQDEEDAGGEAGNANGHSSIATGGRKKARSIRFADDDELHEIIGFSERYSDGDDSDEEQDFRPRGRRTSIDDGDDAPLTVEERNVINLTKKNTNFNAHAQNLLGGVPLRLGDKRHVSTDDGPLLVTVRPFSSRPTATAPVEPSFGKVNKQVRNVTAGSRMGEEMCEVGSDAVDGEEHISRANFAAARLSFLNSTLAQESVAESIQKQRNKCVSEVEVEMGENEAIVKREADDDSGRQNDSESKGEERRPPSMSEVSPGADEDAAGEFKEGEEEDVVAKEVDEQFENANAAHDCGPNTKAAPAAATAANNGNKPPVVKLMRRTSSNSPGSTILKGTPKPVVVVKSKQAAPAPPPPPLPAKEKPKIPAKPKILLAHAQQKARSAAEATTPTPVAAPRRGPSFSRKGPAPVADPARRESPGEYVSLAAECYSTEADAQNEVIFEVNATRVKEVEEEEEAEEETSSEGGDEMENTVSDRQEKNRNALDEIKKSLEASKCDDGSDGQSNSMSSYTSSSTSASSVTTASSMSSSSTSSSFDEARASVASALTFNRHDAVARPSTKKNKAPNPPTAVANAEGTAAAEKEIAETDEKSDSCNSSSAIIESPATAVTKREEGESTPTMPPSALRSANKPSGGEKPARVVQFSPDTKTTSTQPTATPVPYNKWIANAGVFESSFTGQPVKVAPAATAVAAPTATVSRRPVKSAVSVAAAASSVSSVAAPSMSTVTPGWTVARFASFAWVTIDKFFGEVSWPSCKMPS